MRHDQPNARFWVHINGSWTKLTLAPREELNWRSHRETDEGYRYEEYTWAYEDGEVTVERYEKERDCDGLHENGESGWCPVGELLHQPLWDYDEVGAGDEKRPTYVLVPAWRWDTPAYHRDHTAEQAGY